jgi:(E)-4-hydroxy-3-methylbut-2-enyl-diphosphate synthase
VFSLKKFPTHRVQIGKLALGGDEAVRIQSMTNTNTEQAPETADQIMALARAGSEMVRLSVNTGEAAKALESIAGILSDKGFEDLPLIGDFHYNGHKLLKEYPTCARILAKYRINPGNVGSGKKRDENFHSICQIARDNGKAIRIGVNGGSLDSSLVAEKMTENSRKNLGRSPEDILNTCMIESALRSTEMALESGLEEENIIISCKVSSLPQLLTLYRELAEKTRQPLHLGLTEAGMGEKGIVASTAALAPLLLEGIGQTIRVSLTPEPGGDRCREVRVAREILQALQLRAFAPDVTACPGCGRTTSTVFQKLALDIDQYLKTRMPLWEKTYKGVENLKVAVMGCIVNGPGESKSADIGISLPGTGESPKAPVYVDGRLCTTLEGNSKKLAEEFQDIVDDYVKKRYGK